MTLYDATRHLHHACEAHPFGQRMSQGAIAPMEWAYWLTAMRVLHAVVDWSVPAHMIRDGLLADDLARLPRVVPSPAALRFAADLAEGNGCIGAAYVLHGAHRSGGRMMSPVLAKAGLPSAHTAYADQAAAQDWIRSAREKLAWADQASATFACLLRVMDEIEAQHE